MGRVELSSVLIHEQNIQTSQGYQGPHLQLGLFLTQSYHVFRKFEILYLSLMDNFYVLCFMLF